MTEVTLKELMTRIDSGYSFSADVYPALRAANLDQQHYFGLVHSLLHMEKSQGKLATELEAYDHGGMMDDTKLCEAACKQLVNTLKLASHLGLSAEDLAYYVQKSFPAT